MAWALTEDLDEYIAAAGGFLRSRPVHHTIQLTVVETLRVRGGASVRRGRAAVRLVARPGR